MDVKAVAIDIDGTLTDEKRRLHLGVVEKIRELEARGVPVILATGNIMCISEAASIFIGTTGGIIAENGGVVLPAGRKEPIYLGDISKVEKAFKHLSGKLRVEKVSRSELRKTEIAIYRTVDVGDVRRILRGFDVDVVDTKYAIHIKDPAVNKGRALKAMMQEMGISGKNVAAIGDSENDKEMLMYAGYAISVGEKSLRGVSDYITQKSLGEGGEEALEHLLRHVIKTR
jgi:hypothetical protein